MSGIRICYDRHAQQPYVLESIGKKIHTIEELCFYYWNYSHLLDGQAVDEELIFWLRSQLGMEELAARLEKQLIGEASLAELVQTVFSSIQYLSGEEEKQYMEQLSAMSQLSDFERCKRKADDLVRNQKYYKAVREYRSLLKQEEAENDVVAAKIYHNLGVAYCKMFFFKKGSEYFLKAFLKAPGKDTLRQYKAALRLSEESVEEDELVREFPSSAELDLQIYEEIERLKQADSRKLQEIQSLRQQKNDGKVAEYYRKMEEILHNWKEECREYMDIH